MGALKELMPCYMKSIANILFIAFLSMSFSMSAAGSTGSPYKDRYIHYDNDLSNFIWSELMWGDKKLDEWEVILLAGRIPNEIRPLNLAFVYEILDAFDALNYLNRFAESYAKKSQLSQTDILAWFEAYKNEDVEKLFIELFGKRQNFVKLKSTDVVYKTLSRSILRMPRGKLWIELSQDYYDLETRIAFEHMCDYKQGKFIFYNSGAYPTGGGNAKERLNSGCNKFILHFPELSYICQPGLDKFEIYDLAHLLRISSTLKKVPAYLLGMQLQWSEMDWGLMVEILSSYKSLEQIPLFYQYFAQRDQIPEEAFAHLVKRYLKVSSNSESVADAFKNFKENDGRFNLNDFRLAFPLFRQLAKAEIPFTHIQQFLSYNRVFDQYFRIFLLLDRPFYLSDESSTLGSWLVGDDRGNKSLEDYYAFEQPPFWEQWLKEFNLKLGENIEGAVYIPGQRFSIHESINLYKPWFEVQRALKEATDPLVFIREYKGTFDDFKQVSERLAWLFYRNNPDFGFRLAEYILSEENVNSDKKINAFQIFNCWARFAKVKAVDSELYAKACELIRKACYDEQDKVRQKYAITCFAHIAENRDISLLTRLILGEGKETSKVVSMSFESAMALCAINTPDAWKAVSLLLGKRDALQPDVYLYLQNKYRLK
ncbi:MAG: hypothetical protein ACRC37_06695 [Lentisphaeria bacterium]